MSTRFQRPGGRYDGTNTSLTNRSKFQSAEGRNASISSVDVDGDINYLIDATNALVDDITAVEAGNLQGADEPDNAGKLLTTDGNGDLGFTFITSDNIADNGIQLASLQQGTPGELISWDASNNPTTVGGGTANYALISKGAGQLPIFQDLSTHPVIQNILSLLVPAGSIFYWATGVAPDGFILADGTAKSRATYDRLFNVFGTTYGNGDGSTTFGIPDLRGRIIVSPDRGANRVAANNALGQSGGEEKHTLTVNEMPAHTHPLGVNGTNTINDIALVTGLAQRNFGAVTIFMNPTGGDQAHNNMQPYIVLNAIIKT